MSAAEALSDAISHIRFLLAPLGPKLLGLHKFTEHSFIVALNLCLPLRGHLIHGLAHLLELLRFHQERDDSLVEPRC